MSKRDLSKFLEQLTEAELKAQIFDLYGRFKEVKTFYDFSFRPNEEKRFREAKQKIKKEYFPEGKRKAKRRRSIAKRWIVYFQKLEADPSRIADLMIYNIEIAQAADSEKSIKKQAFYQSLLQSFRQGLVFIRDQSMEAEFQQRIEHIINYSKDAEWPNGEAFVRSKSDLWEGEYR